MRKYNFTTFISGHAHSLSFAQKDGIAFYLSGAAGNNGGACSGGDWEKGKVYGFLKQRISNDKLYSTYYYTSDKKNWETYDTPAHDLMSTTRLASLLQ